MAMVNFTVTRNLDAFDARGEPCKIALCTIIHENGFRQTHCINEAYIAFAGEQVIEEQIKERAGG
jgi:hypothetical protein